MIFKNNLKKSIIKISNLIKQTAGAEGRTILINNGVDCVATKDGISVLNAYQPLDNIELASKLLLQQALGRQLLEHGDGTTATACFFGEFLKNKFSLKEIKEMDELVKNTCKQVLDNSKKKFDLLDLALVSSNFDKDIANIVTKAINNNGVNGTYIVEPSSELGIELKQVAGFEFKSGFNNPIFMNKQGICEYLNPLFLCKRDITITDVAKYSQIAIENNKPLVIIGDWDEQVEQSVIYNHSQGICRYCLIYLNEMGKEKNDLINDINEVTKNCKKIIIRSKSTIIEHNTDLKDYVDKINSLEVSSDLEKENNNKRIARLKGEVCKIIVGERTTAGLRSKLDSIDDCIKSCISGLKYGVVQGGGYFLYNLVKNKKLKNIVKSYYSCILENAGKKADGNFHNLNTYNIIDSAGVVASSLNNAWAGAREVLYSKELININHNNN